jgi:hypothetical protein
MATPVQPIHLFGKHKPTARNFFKRESDLWLCCLRRPLEGFDSATAIVFSPRGHLIAPAVKSDYW